MSMQAMSGDQVGIDSAIEQLSRIRRTGASRDWRLVIRKLNPGALAAHQTTDVLAIHAGFDWEAGQVILEPVRPLTELTPEQVNAIVRSVRAGSSWHAYQREKMLRDRIKALEIENARLRAAGV